MSNTYDNIYKLYEYLDCNNSTYLKKYGFDIFITLIFLIIIIYTITYLYIKLNISKIKKNWNNYKCNPNYIPFAGIINKPENMSAFEYTKYNFDICSIQILKTISNNATKPITYFQNLIFSILKSISSSINLMRIVFNKMKINIIKITKSILSRIMNVILPFINMILNIRDLIAKINGVFASIIYTLYGLLLSLINVLKMIKTILIIIVVTVIIVFIILAIAIGWFVPPLLATLPAYIAMGALVTTVVASITVLLYESFNTISSATVPNIPSYCFDKNTILHMNDNTKKYIKNIKLGDILHDGSIVEAIMVSKSDNTTMYKFKNIIVSNKHKIFDKLYGWINVEEHPLSVKIDNYNEPYIYCLSTNSKTINIDNNIFSDWDELDDIDIYTLKEKFNFIKDYSEINKLNCCFHPDTELLLNNNNKINIKNIKIGDTLYKNNKVLSIIKIKSDKLNFKEYKCKNSNFNIKATSNIILHNYDNIKTNKIDSPDTAYNIITSKGYILIDNLEINDFINSGIELYLQ